VSAGVERESAIGSFLWGGRERVLAVLPMLTAVVIVGGGLLVAARALRTM
jgi:hypothetical protein